MTDPQSPESQPKLVRGEELETEDGVETPVQQAVGAEEAEGGGEWPDPQTPPRLPAPGAADD
jgi:hypothetical protein